jgi:leader peptidase (prepilin peptidase) / N-methyltransferase
MNTALVAAFAFLFGATMGSFLNVCISRWPSGGSIIAPRSRCPKCGTAIAWYDNVPIVSWLLLRARCRNCGAPISVQYPLVELTVALLWLSSVLAYGPGFTAIRLAVFGTVLLGIAVTDARHFLIPDGFTVFGLVWVLATAGIAWFVQSNGMFASPVAAVFGACTGAGAIAIVGWLGEIAFRREAMGFGDVTLMAFAGAALGPGRSLLTIFLGAVLALVGLVIMRLAGISDKFAMPAEPTVAGAETVLDHDADSSHRHVPFGVFLAPAALIALLWGEALITWYILWVRTGALT